MQFSRCLAFVSLFSAALAQVDLQLVVAELPPCALQCSLQTLPSAGCLPQNISTCLCTNATLHGQLSVCVQNSCNETEIITTLAVSQDLICKGIPYPSRSEEIARTISIISAIGFVIVTLRLTSRLLVTHMWWDDWAVIAASAFMFPMSAIAIYSTTKGFGTHSWDVPPGDVHLLLVIYYVAQLFYVVAQPLAKISILLLFLRIFPDDRFRFVTKIAIALMVLQTIAFSISITLQCTPVSAVWDITRKGKCINSSAVVAAGAGFSIFEDLVIILLPVPQLKQLNFSLWRRLAVIAMFAMGSFACITSMIRLKYLASYSVRAVDEPWDSVDIIIWSILETYTAVICACLITIRPLLAKYMPSIFKSGNASTPYFATSLPHISSQQLSTLPSGRVDSLFAEPGWTPNIGPVIEFKDPESGRAQTHWESSYGEGGNKQSTIKVTKIDDVHDRT